MIYNLENDEKLVFEAALEVWNNKIAFSANVSLNGAKGMFEGLLGNFSQGILDSVLNAWHGFGIDDRAGSKKLLLFTASGVSIDALRKIATSFGDALPVDVLQIPRFQFCASPAKPAIAIKPGQGIFAKDSTCSDPQGKSGSIGAFLKFTDGTGPVFVLSASHVLGRPCQSAAPDIHLDNGSQPVISKTVHAVKLQKTGSNVADAAVAELSDSDIDVENFFTGITITSATPVTQPLEPGTAVEKLGMSTNVTKGRVVIFCPKIQVLPDTAIGTVEFDDQLMIVSQDDQPFVAEGDSGGLVVSNGSPAGIVIAKSKRMDIPGPPPAAPGGADGRYALASPFDVVLQQLGSPSVLGHPVKMVL